MSKSGVERWETDDVVFSGSEHAGQVIIGVVAEVTHPVFKDGNEGKPRLGVTITRAPNSTDRFFMRLMCRNGSLDEIRALHMSLEQILKKEDECKRKLDVRHDAWNKKRIDEHNEWTQRQAGKTKRNASAGQGLSRFSGESKTKRTRSKKKGSQGEHKEA